MLKPEKIIHAINEGIFELENTSFTADELYNAALAREQLEQLHALYKTRAPSGSKISEKYHHRNLKTSLDQDFVLSPENIDECTRAYVEYRINHGRKFLLIHKLTDKDIQSFTANTAADFNHLKIEPEIFLDDDSIDAQAIPLRTIYKRTTPDLSILLFFEGVETFSSSQPSDNLLSQEGLKLKNQIRVKKKVISYGFHRVVIDTKNKLLIALLDVNTLDKKEDPSDKFYSLINLLRHKLGITNFMDKLNLLGFFPSLDKLFNDKSVGIVKEVYLHTSAGARSLNTTKVVESDVRDDVFLKGGIEAEEQEIAITKLNLSWPNIEGTPELKLKGDFIMFENPKEALFWSEVLFSAKSAGQADFLIKPLEYAINENDD